MTIGELAAGANVNIQTVRFYEREGLLRKPARTAAGYRSYEGRDLEQVKFIKVCQGLGFTLREINQLMQLHGVMASPGGAARLKPSAVQDILAIAQERICSMEEKIAALSKMRTDLPAVAEALASPGLMVCPAIAPPASSLTRAVTCPFSRPELDAESELLYPAERALRSTPKPEAICWSARSRDASTSCAR